MTGLSRLFPCVGRGCERLADPASGLGKMRANSPVSSLWGIRLARTELGV